MHKLTGPKWFEKFRGEKTRSDAMARLVATSGLSLHTLYKAFVSARPIRADVARRLGEVAGDDLDISSLTLPDEAGALASRAKRARSRSEEPAPTKRTRRRARGVS